MYTSWPTQLHVVNVQTKYSNGIAIYKHWFIGIYAAITDSIQVKKN